MFTFQLCFDSQVPCIVDCTTTIKIYQSESGFTYRTHTHTHTHTQTYSMWSVPVLLAVLPFLLDGDKHIFTVRGLRSFRMNCFKYPVCWFHSQHCSRDLVVLSCQCGSTARVYASVRWILTAITSDTKWLFFWRLCSVSWRNSFPVMAARTSAPRCSQPWLLQYLHVYAHNFHLLFLEQSAASRGPERSTAVSRAQLGFHDWGGWAWLCSTRLEGREGKV